MPIRPENKARYPKDWPEIRARILTRANNCCEFCGVRNRKRGGRTRAGVFHEASPTGTDGLRLTWPRKGDIAHCQGYDIPLRIIEIVLTIAHLNHTPEDCRDENLRALCQRCHLSLDAKHHAHNASITRAEKRGQIDMFGRI